MSSVEGPFADVTPEELAAARRYPMEIEWSDEDDAFLVSFPDAPGVMTHGATREEAAAMGDDAIISWYTALKDAGRPIPPPALTARQAGAMAPERLEPDRVREIRRRLDVSQQVFAELLNVSLTTVRSWEQGWRTPNGASLRLLRIAEEHPEVLMEASAPQAKRQPERVHAVG